MGFKKLIRLVHFSNLIIIPIRRVSMVYFDSEILNRLLEYHSEQPPNLSKIYVIERLLFGKIISTIRIEETDSSPQEKHYQFRLCPFGTILGSVFFSVDSEKEMKRIRAFYDNFYDHKFSITMAKAGCCTISGTNKMIDTAEAFISPVFKPKTNERVKEYITDNHISSLEDLLTNITTLLSEKIDEEVVETKTVDVKFTVEPYPDNPELNQRAKEFKKCLEQYGTKIGKDELNNDTASNQS